MSLSTEPSPPDPIDPIDLLPDPALVPRSQARAYLGVGPAVMPKWATQRLGPPSYLLGAGRAREAMYVAADLRLFKRLRAERKSLAAATTAVNRAVVARQLAFGVRYIFGQPVGTTEGAAQ